MARSLLIKGQMINVFRFKRLVDAAAEGLKERDEIISCSLLAMLSGQSVFFFGPPGTAKSLIARRLAGLFKSSAYFECLMNRFTTPEEMFGPVSIRELKTADRYIRKTEGFLPTADFAFLDEIWKSSPGILNALLTILNERKFRNGDKVEDVPLKAIVAASNEIPSEGQGLEALYDRFIMRLIVPPVAGKAAFEGLLGGGTVGEDVALDEAEKISNDEWREMLASVSEVKVSKDAFAVIHMIRSNLAERDRSNKPEKGELPKPPIYVSDRRWIKAVRVARTAAAVCGRREVLPVDLLVIADCLWSRAEDRDEIRKTVDEAVKVRSGEGASEMLDWNKRFTAFENSILNPAPKPDEESGVKVVNGVRSYCIAACRATNSQEVYIPQAWENTEREFHPLDTDGYSCKDVICKTLGKGNFEVWNGNGTKIVFTAKQRGRVSAATTQGAAAQLEKARELLDEVIKIGYSMVAKGGVSAAGYPFVDRKRLDAVNDGCEKNRAMISEGKVRCEYLVHRLSATK